MKRRSILMKLLSKPEIIEYRKSKKIFKYAYDLHNEKLENIRKSKAKAVSLKEFF